MTSSSTKARGVYVALALATIVAGLLVHRRIVPLGPVARDVVGDALWAGMMVWWIGAARPAARASRRAIIAFGVCIVVELSQLYSGPPLAALRQTRFGHLVLGSGFDPRDLAAYALGVVGAWWLDGGWIARLHTGPSQRTGQG